MKFENKTNNKFITVPLACALLTLSSGPLFAQTAISKEDAAKVAAETLGEKLSMSPDSLNVVHVSIMDWPDSSLGCPKPGVEYLQVVTRGAVVLMQADSKPYRVHVTNDRAIVCDVSTRDSLSVGSRQPAGMAMRQVMQTAQADLAKKFGVAQTDVTVKNVESKTWPDSSLGCKASPDAMPEDKVEGFRITLEYRGQDFTYHTDQQRAIPCPPIEME